MSSSFRRPLAIIVAVTFGVQTSGCTTWTQRSEPPAQVLAQQSPQQVRVTLADGRVLELAHATLVGDTLTGMRPWAPGDPAAGNAMVASPPKVQAHIPLSNVTRLEVQHVSAGRTTALVLGIGATALVVGGIIAAAGASSTGCCDFSGDGGYGASCPLVYSWDGTDWRLDSGTFGGAIMPGLQRTDLDELVAAVPVADTLHLRVTGQQNETEFVDALAVLAVDHPAGTEVAPDARQNGGIHTIGRPAAPLSARDDAGRDVSDAVAAPGGRLWESELRPRDADAAGARDGVELAFARPAGVRTAKLVVVGANTPWAAHMVRRLVRANGRDVLRWYDPASSARAARSVLPLITEEASLTVSVWRDGEWQRAGTVWEAGPEVMKRQVLPLDLARVTGDTLRIRVESVPAFWAIDQLAVDWSEDGPMRVTTLTPARAELAGAYDPAGLLAAVDGAFMTLGPNDAARLAWVVPSKSADASRSYLVRSNGWYRVNGAEQAPPDSLLLAQLRAPVAHAASRLAVRLLNEAIVTASAGEPVGR